MVTETQQPKATVFDDEGRPTTQHETVTSSKENEVESIPWTTWAEKATQPDSGSTAKMLVSLSVRSVNAHLDGPIPISLVRKGNAVQALATKGVRVGGFLVPLYFRKDSSMVVHPAVAGSIHPKAVTTEVSWALPISELEKEAGVENGGEERIAVCVPPEVKLPTQNDKGGWVWTQSDNVHPFWLIKRTKRTMVRPTRTW